MTDEVTRFEIAKLELRAGDRLVVKSEMLLSRDQIAHIEEHFARYMPEGVKVIVLGAGLTLEVLRRAEP